MNTNIDKQSETSETARIDYRETVTGEAISAREIWQRAQREIRLQAARAERPFAKRARKAGRFANRNAWKLLHAIHAEIAPRVRALRGLYYLEA